MVWAKEKLKKIFLISWATKKKKNSNQSIFLLAQPEKEFFNLSELQENQEYQLFAQPCGVDRFALENLQRDAKKKGKNVSK